MRKRPRRSAAEVQLSRAEKLGERLARSPYRMFTANELTSTTLTVSDVAAALEPLTKDTEGTIQRIRHWTREGVLQPIKFGHSGPGKHRRYNPAAVYSAAVLHVITAAGLPVAHSQFLTDLMRQVNELAARWITASDRAEIIKRGRMTVGVTPTGTISRVGHEPQGPAEEVLSIIIDLGKIFAAVDSSHGRP
jgi:DNA-binding transcriptional MerR regulator